MWTQRFVLPWTKPYVIYQLQTPIPLPGFKSATAARTAHFERVKAHPSHDVTSFTRDLLFPNSLTWPWPAGLDALAVLVVITWPEPLHVATIYLASFISFVTACPYGSLDLTGVVFPFQPLRGGRDLPAWITWGGGGLALRRAATTPPQPRQRTGCC